MAIAERTISHWKLFIDGEASGFLGHSTPAMEHGYLCCFADEKLTQPQGYKEAHIQHWKAVPVYAD